MVKSLSNVIRDPSTGNILLKASKLHLDKLYPKQKTQIITKSLEYITSINQTDEDKIEIAVLLSEINADPVVILSSLFFDLDKDDLDDLNFIDEKTKQTIISILKGFKQLNKWRSLKSEIQKSENKKSKSISMDLEYKSQMIRKMLLSLVGDVRIVLIYLAYQLINLRKIKNIKDTKQQVLFAKKILMLDASLANRLGIVRRQGFCYY